MKLPIFVACGLLLAGAVANAVAGDLSLEGSVPEIGRTIQLSKVAAKAAAKRGGSRRAGCVVEADQPIYAVNQDGNVPVETRMPVEIKQISPTKIELRVAGQRSGAGPFDAGLRSKSIAAVMVAETAAPNDWLVGILAQEMTTGGRFLSAWQQRANIDEPMGGLSLDLATDTPQEFTASVPVNEARVQIHVVCSPALR